MKSNMNVRPNPEKGLSRIESFSDSIFGFAITLLVLELLQIPRPDFGQDLLLTLRSNWQHFFAFMVGFFTILICWINHHHLFCYMVQYDGRFLLLNGGLLLIVTFTPLPTALLSEFLSGKNSTGLILFGLTYFLMASMAYFMWAYAWKNKFLDDSIDSSYYQSIRRIFRYSILYTLVTFSLCFFSIAVPMIMYALLFGVFAFPHYFALRLKNIRS